MGRVEAFDTRWENVNVTIPNPEVVKTVIVRLGFAEATAQSNDAALDCMRNLLSCQPLWRPYNLG